MKPGDILDGRYEIIARLGAGGMGEVYQARHTYLGSARVIKIVHPQISSSSDARDRFLREARAATKIQHPNVATLHDFASLPDGSHYMVWEFIDGENLAQRLRAQGTLAPRQAVHITIQALRGLEAIHRAGIVHRDISPENLMITPHDELKIIDLGVAKIEDPDAVSTTQTGIFVGKLRYAAPEQLGFLPDGEKIDGRTDLYAMAMTVVELLTGRPPYEAKSPHEYFLHHAREMKVTKVALPPELPGSGALTRVLEKALARDRNERYASARELAAALETIELTLPDARRTPTVALALDSVTVRTPAPGMPTVPNGYLDASTVRTPVPQGVPQTPPVPQPLMAAPVQQRAGVSPALLVVAFLAFLLIAAGAFAFLPRISRFISRSTETLPLKTETALTHPTVTSELATTSVTVTSPTTTTTTTTSDDWQDGEITFTAELDDKQVITIQTRDGQTIPIEITRDGTLRPQIEEPVKPESIAVYVDAPESSRSNDRALERLRQELRGVNEVALRAGGHTTTLYRALHGYLPHLTFSSEADVVIRFDGAADRLRRQGRPLTASATIEKNGQVIFRYELPDSTDHPDAAGAFAQTIAAAFEE